MKFAIALVALLAATTEATKLSREMLGKSYDTASKDDYYSVQEMMDRTEEIKQAKQMME